MASKITTQDLEISTLKARIKLLEDRHKGGDDPSREDATIKGRSLETGEEAGVEKSTKRGKVATISVPTGSGLVPTASPIFTTASVVTPYSRRKGKEKMVESDTPKKKKLQEQIDVQVEREIEEQMAREDQRRNEQIERDAEIARIHAEEELQMMIDVLKSHSGWKTKHFKVMSLEEIREKFIPVWKYIEDFVPMASKEERERFKRKGLREDLTQLWTLVRETLSNRQATSDKEKELWVDLKRLYKPDVKDQLWTHTQALIHDPVECRLYDTRGVHHVLSRDQEIFINRQATSDKEKELWVDLKRLYKPDVKDQLWIHTQALIHDPMECRLYDTRVVHHVLSRDQEIFMLVEKTTH
nr:hypothetical protein [Tanacetum cinerariifolium]